MEPASPPPCLRGGDSPEYEKLTALPLPPLRETDSLVGRSPPPPPPPPSPSPPSQDRASPVHVAMEAGEKGP